MATNLIPARRPPPGRILSQELEERGWTQKDLAQIMGRPEQVISEIINNKKQITPETAKELAAALGNSPEFWYNLETKYQLFLAGKTKIDDAIERRARLYDEAPISELISRGWLDISASSTINELEESLRSFLRQGPDFKNSAHLRCNDGTKAPDKNSQFAWGHYVASRAHQQKIESDFDIEKYKKELPNVLKFSKKIEDIQHIPSFLANLGVHFVIVRHLSKTYLDGAAFKLKTDRPVIALTLRYDRVDAFWFTFLHECAHIALDHPSNYFDNKVNESEGDNFESEADAQAQAWLIDPNSFSEFKSKYAFSKTSIIRFSEEIQRHPGIIVGRLQHEKILTYAQQRGFLEKVSPYLESHIY